MDSTFLGILIGAGGAILPSLLNYFNPPVATSGPIESGDTPDAPQDASAPLESSIPYVALDVLRCSVRPVLTYAFFGTFIVVKGVVLGVALISSPADAGAVGSLLWNDGTETLFAAVMAFWFGSRALRK